VNVVGLTGFAGSGKSTVANYLVEEHGYTRLSFAGPLKKMLRTLNPIMGDMPVAYHEDNVLRLSNVWGLAERHIEFWDYAGTAEQWIKESEYGDEYRRLLQVLGTDCIRAVDPEFWVKAAIAQMEDEDGKYVFDDCRFPNEAAVITVADPRSLWYVERPGIHPVNGHASEQHAGKMGEKVWLLNSMSTQELFDQVDYHVTQMAVTA
jgi:hypothetical protein